MPLEKVGSFILSSESLDRHSEKVITKGIDIRNFKKNPVMLFNHKRTQRWMENNVLPIGIWKNIKKTDSGLVADAYIDFDDEFAAAIGNKVRSGVLSAVSIGFKALAYSDDPKDKDQGQRGYTITKSELLEASIVDIPANPNAVATSIEKTFSDDQFKGVQTPVAPKEIQEIIFYKSIGSQVEQTETKDTNNEKMDFLNFIKSEAKRLWGKTFGEEVTEAEVKEFIEKQESISELTEKMKGFEESNETLKTQLEESNAKASEFDEKGKALGEAVNAKFKKMQAAFDEKFAALEQSSKEKIKALEQGLKDTAIELNKYKVSDKSGEKTPAQKAAIKEEIEKAENDETVVISKEAAKKVWW